MSATAESRVASSTLALVAEMEVEMEEEAVEAAVLASPSREMESVSGVRAASSVTMATMLALAAVASALPVEEATAAAVPAMPFREVSATVALAANSRTTALEGAHSPTSALRRPRRVEVEAPLPSALPFREVSATVATHASSPMEAAIQETLVVVPAKLRECASPSRLASATEERGVASSTRSETFPLTMATPASVAHVMPSREVLATVVTRAASPTTSPVTASSLCLTSPRNFRSRGAPLRYTYSSICYI